MVRTVGRVVRIAGGGSFLSLYGGGLVCGISNGLGRKKWRVMSGELLGTAG